MTNSHMSHSTEIETSTAYDEFTFAGYEWLPEVLEGQALDAKLSDIEKNGLITPILADENNVIYDGRLRFCACKELMIPLKIQRINSEDGEAAARRGLMHRQMTVLDDVRFVGTIADELKGNGEEVSGRKLAEHMTSVYGRQRGVSYKQMEHIMEIFEALPDLDDDQVAQVRNAKTVNAARKALGLIKKPKAKKGKHLTMSEVREKIQEIIEDAQSNPGVSPESLINDLTVLLKELSTDPLKPANSETPIAKEKKGRGKKPKAA